MKVIPHSQLSYTQLLLFTSMHGEFMEKLRRSHIPKSTYLHDGQMFKMLKIRSQQLEIRHQNFTNMAVLDLSHSPLFCRTKITIDIANKGKETAYPSPDLKLRVKKHFASTVEVL